MMMTITEQRRWRAAMISSNATTPAIACGRRSSTAISLTTAAMSLTSRGMAHRAVSDRLVCLFLEFSLAEWRSG